MKERGEREGDENADEGVERQVELNDRSRQYLAFLLEDSDPRLIEPLKHPTSQNAQQSEILVPQIRITTRHLFLSVMEVGWQTI